MKTTLTILSLIMLVSMVLVVVNAQPATVEVTPASYTVPDVGLSFEVNVTVRDVDDLYGFAFSLFYPNDILNGTSVTEGPFLEAGGFRTVFFKFDFSDSYSPTEGRLQVGCTRTGNVTGASGTGTLATITFKSTSTNAPKPLHLADVALSDSNETAIAMTTIDGEVTVLPEFPTGLLLPLVMVSAIAIISLCRRIGN
jgi:hypothetical protein